MAWHGAAWHGMGLGLRLRSEPCRFAYCQNMSPERAISIAILVIVLLILIFVLFSWLT